MKGRYPLEALLAIRQGEAEGCQREFAEAIARREQAKQALRDAERRVLEQQERLDSATHAAFRELTAGGMRSADVSMAAGHCAGLKQALLGAMDRVDEAKERCQESQVGENRAREQLAQARAALSAVERHRAEFLDTIARQEEEQNEQDAAEVHLARVPRPAQRRVSS